MPRTRRPGFTLIEVAVWVAVIAILAATVTPVLLAVVDAERRGRALTLLERIETGINAFDDDLSTYPASMTQIFGGISAGQSDLCGRNYRVSDVNKWEGPYIHMVPSGGQFPVGTGAVADGFTYQVIGGTPYIRITINEVLEEDAEALDARGEATDAELGAGAGTFRWGAPDADGFVTMTYNMAVMAC